MGLVIAFAPMHGPRGDEPRWIFVAFGAMIALAAAALSALTFVAAQRIGERRSRTFCIVVAAVTCLGIPYGSALGALALIVLCRQSVASQFHES